jgi:hypothetical protein
MRLTALRRGVVELKDTLTYSGIFWAGVQLGPSNSIATALRSNLCTLRLFECIITASDVSCRTIASRG